MRTLDVGEKRPCGETLNTEYWTGQWATVKQVYAWQRQEMSLVQ